MLILVLILREIRVKMLRYNKYYILLFMNEYLHGAALMAEWSKSLLMTVIRLYYSFYLNSKFQDIL